MKKIDKELKKDEPRIMKMVGKGNGKKYRGNSNNTNNRKVSEGTDWFRSKILIARFWVKYLGLKKMINKDIKALNDLKRVNRKFLGIKKVILLKINISRKEVEWRVWVVNKMIVLLIIENNFHDGRLVINYLRLT